MIQSKKLDSDFLKFQNPRIKGFYVYNPYQVKLQQKIIAYFNHQLEQKGYLNYCFPSVGLMSDLAAEREFFQLNNECFKLNDSYYLKPTSEAVAYPFIVQKQFQNFKYYQVGPVFRNESKQCKKLIRSRELTFFHESHAIVESRYADATFEEAKLLYEDLFEKLQIPVVLNYRPEDDRFPGAEKTLAFDSVETQSQVASIHLLKPEFLEAFGSIKDKRIICFGFTQRIQHCLTNIPSQFHPYPVVIINMTSQTLPGFENYTVLNYQYKKEPFSKFMKRVDQTYNPLIKVKLGSRELESGVVFVEYDKEKVLTKVSQLKNTIDQILKDKAS